MDELVKQFGLNFKLVFIQLIGFILLYLLLKKFLFGRITEMVQKRGDEIRSSYENNEKTREEVVALKNEYEKKLQDARMEADSIIKNAKDMAEKAGQEIIDKTRTEAGRIKDKGLAEIEQEKKRVIAEIRTEVVNISVEIASRVVKKTISADDARSLADEVFEEIGKVNP
jgi:F-type H+-transporting ATPase subunit b